MKKLTGAIVLPEEALEYTGQWITLSPDYKEVLGHGTADEAAEMAEKSKWGFGLLLFMREDWDRDRI